MQRVKFLLLGFLLCALASSVWAQSVQVRVVMPPPYSVHLEDYLAFRAKSIVTLTNTTSESLQIKLLGNASSLDGRISVAVLPSFQPAAPIVLAPFETKILNGEQLRSTNGNLSPDHITYQGLDVDYLLRTGTLPEGHYQFCLRAYDYQGTTPLSPDMAGCAVIQLSHYDPPIIIQPTDDSNVWANNPQLLNFVWTPAGIPGTTRYTLRLVDMTDTGLFNPNDAFAGMVLPFFEKTNLFNNTFVYTNADLPLQTGHRYAVQVQAYDPSQQLSYKNGGRSAVTTFTWKPLNILNGDAIDPVSVQGNVFNPGGVLVNNNPDSQPPAPNGQCASATLYNGPLNGAPISSITNGTTVSVGHFVMKQTVFTKNNGGSFNGTGVIFIDFLNLSAEVAFQGIQVNAANRMVGGKITGKVTANTLVNDNMSQVKDGAIAELPNAQGLYDFLQNANNLISNINPNVPRALPVSLDGDAYNVGIVGLIFEPNQAYLNAVLPVPVPQSLYGDWLTIGTKGIPVQPNGWGAATVNIGLAQTQVLPLSDKLSLTIVGGPDKTFVTLDCDGFHALKISGAFELARQAALPLDNQFNVIADANIKVKVPFVLDGTTNLEDFLLDGAAFSHPFSIPEAQDFVIQAGGVSIDFASSANGATFQTAFPHQSNDWIGLYLKDVTLVLPQGFKKEGGGRIALQLQHLLADKQGISFDATASGEPLAAGSLAGWGFQLDMLNLQLAHSKLAGGGLGGKIWLPLGEMAAFGFAATVTKGDQHGANYAFALEIGNTVEADLFLAQIALHEGSSIQITREGGKFSASSNLNGTVGIAIAQKKPGSNVGKMDVPELKFQSLTITGKDEPGFVPQFDLQFASLNSQGNIQAKIGDAFELKLNELAFAKKMEDGKQLVGLKLGFGVSLFGGQQDQTNGVAANTAFTAWAKYDASKRTFAYHKATLDALAIKADVGAAMLEGSVEIFEQNDEYGNGFRGGVKAYLRGLDAGVEVNAQFGRTLANKGHFKYWYFDAMAEIPSPGIFVPVVPIALYGFGGGAWCNMARSGGIGSAALKPGQYQPNPSGGGAPTVSGASFTPSQGACGFSASTVIGLAGAKDAFNADLVFSMAFDANTLAVSEIRLEGQGYTMQDTDVVPREPGSSAVTSAVALVIDLPSRSFAGSAVVSTNSDPKTTGAGSIYFQLPQKDGKGNPIPNSNAKWHLKLGWWTPGANPFDDPTRIKGMLWGTENMLAEYNAKFQGYIMAGNDLPNGLPTLPTYIYDAVKDKGAVAQQSLPAQVADTQNLAFALGAGIQFNAGFDFKILYADLQAEAAFDVLISNLNAACDGQSIGFNGWYAQGQIYAYVKGEGGLFGIPLVEVAAGAVLQAKLPNPTWAKGAVVMYINIGGHEAGYYEGDFERGTACNVQTQLDPFANVQLIKAANPTHLTTGVDPADPDIWIDFAYAHNQNVSVYNAYTQQNASYKALSEAVLKTKTGEQVPLSDSYWVGSKLYLVPQGILKGSTEYHLILAAQIKQGNQVEAEEQTIVKFGTGAAPSEFNLSHLAEAYPFPGQRYFMKESFDGGASTGFMRLKQDLCYLINPAGKKSYVEFVEGGTGQVRTAPCSCTGQQGYTGRVFFSIPQGLKNETIYHLRIVNKPIQIIQQQDEDLVPAASEYVFEGLYFRTSKYNNMATKLNSMQLAKVAYVKYNAAYSFNYYGNAKGNAHTYHVPVLLFTHDEPLERYDTEFYQTGNNDGQQYLGKLVREYKPQENWMSQWSGKYKQFLGLSASDRQFLTGLAGNGSVQRMAGFPFNGQTTTAMKFQLTDMYYMGNTAYYDMVLRANGELTGGETLRLPSQPLSGNEIQQAFANLPGNQPNGNANIVFANNGGGGMQNNTPNLQFQANVTPYIAIMDFTPMVANYDKQQYDTRILNAALGNGGFQFLQAYNLLKGLGWTEYTGSRTLEFRTWEPRQGQPPAWKSFLRNYVVTK